MVVVVPEESVVVVVAEAGAWGAAAPASGVGMAGAGVCVAGIAAVGAWAGAGVVLADPCMVLPPDVLIVVDVAAGGGAILESVGFIGACAAGAAAAF